MNNTPAPQHLERIGRRTESSCPGLEFMRSSLFFGCGTLLTAVATADFILKRSGGPNLELWLTLAGSIGGGIGLTRYARRHRTVTECDRTLMNAWSYAPGITLYAAAQCAPIAQLPLSPLGMLFAGTAIATGITARTFRRDTANRSQLSGTPVLLHWTCLGGALASAWILSSAAAGQWTAQYLFTLAAILLTLAGTGCVLRRNERRRV